jgi:hypothetical protein
VHGQRRVEQDHGVEEVLRIVRRVHRTGLVDGRDIGDPDVRGVLQRVERALQVDRRSPRLEPSDRTALRIGCISPVSVSVSMMFGFGVSVTDGSG